MTVVIRVAFAFVILFGLGFSAHQVGPRSGARVSGIEVAQTERIHLISQDDVEVGHGIPLRVFVRNFGFADSKLPPGVIEDHYPGTEDLSIVRVRVDQAMSYADLADVLSLRGMRLATLRETLAFYEKNKGIVTNEDFYSGLTTKNRLSRLSVHLEKGAVALELSFLPLELGYTPSATILAVELPDLPTVHTSPQPPPRPVVIFLDRFDEREAFDDMRERIVLRRERRIRNVIRACWVVLVA